MVLSLQQVKERIRTPASSSAILEAQLHENRIKFHTKAVDREGKISPYFHTFIAWVTKLLPSDKVQSFRDMCILPLATTALCNSVFDEYEKMFTAQDSYFDVEMLDDTMAVEYKKYLQDIDIVKYFKTVAFRSYQTQPNCVFVVDLPAIQTTDRPRPYYYKVDVSNFHELELKRDYSGNERIALLIFKISDKKFIVIDDTSYRVMEETEEGDSEGRKDYRLLSESFHNLGFVPATFLPKTPLYSDDEAAIVRKVQTSDNLGDLDWLLFFKVAARVYETYGPFPIMVMPEDSCEYTDAAGNICTSGVVSYMKENGEVSSYACPACAKKNNFAGAGTIVEVPYPKTKDDPVLPDAVKIIAPHIPSLDYIQKKIDFLEWEIYANCVGSADETVTKEAVNQKQVQVTVEGKRNVLLRIKRDFEATQKFLVDTMGKLMYGDYYLNCVVNYGEQFLLYTAKDIADQYKIFKEVGVSGYITAQKKKQLIQTEYRNNPYELKRAQLLDLLEPFSELSLSECVTYQLDLKYPEKFLLKLDFAKFISRFELTNGDIVQWGMRLSTEKKIDTLTQKLIEYVKQSISTEKSILAESSDSASGKNTRAVKA
jgi:hypothetical protein